MQHLGHWNTVAPIPETFFGFVYCITNTLSSRKYYGKKQAQSVVKLKPLKGQKRRRTKVKETDWKTYTGSSPELNQDIETIGKDKFHFEILRFCTCKWELAYHEGKIQFEKDVLYHPNKYYNGIINLRIGRVPKALK